MNLTADPTSRSPRAPEGSSAAAPDSDSAGASSGLSVPTASSSGPTPGSPSPSASPPPAGSATSPHAPPRPCVLGRERAAAALPPAPRGTGEPGLPPVLSIPTLNEHEPPGTMVAHAQRGGALLGRAWIALRARGYTLIAVLLALALSAVLVLVTMLRSTGAIAGEGFESIPIEGEPPATAVSIGGEHPADRPGPGAAPGAGASGDGPAAEVWVHVVGAVAAPGLYRLPGGARVEAAIEGAGGPAEDARIEGINLARPLVDGEQLRVPREGEEPPPAPEGPAGAGVSGAGAGGGPVHINSAGIEELQRLPRVGPATAERIHAWREANGPFRSVEELVKVPGIGPKTVEGFGDLARL